MEFIEKLRKLPGFTVLVAIAYLRISTDREQVYSIEEQRFDIQEFADKWGILIVDWVIDRGLSGGTFEKRKIAEIIERIRIGEHGENLALVALRDRWGRDPDLNKAYERHLQSAGGHLIAARRPVDPTTSHGRTQIQTDDFIAGIQRHQIGDSWQNTVKRRRREQLPHTAAERFGYRICEKCTMQVQALENGKIRRRVIKKCGECGGVHQLDAPRAKALKEFYERYTGYGDWPGGESARKLAIEMAARGIRSVRGNVMTANQWLNVMDTGYAAGLLRSRTVPRRGRGLTMSYKSDRPDTFDVWAVGKHEAIIDMGCWKKYRAMRAVTPSESRSRAQIKYPLSGLLRCGRLRDEKAKADPLDEQNLCMAKMFARGPVISKGGRHVSLLYGCENVKHKRCKGLTISRDRAHAMALNWVIAHAMDEQAGRAALADQVRAEVVLDDAREIQRKISLAEGKLSRLTDLKLAGDIHPVAHKLKEAEILAELAPLESQLAHLRARAPRNSRPPREEFTALVEMWPKATAAEQHSMLEPLIRYMVVYRIPGKRGNMLRIIPAWEVAPETAA